MATDDAAEIRDLFAEVIPEVANGNVEIKAIAREKGTRTKVAVFSRDRGVECMAACVGERGVRIRTIVERTGGMERFDIVKWDESMETYIANALQPAEIVFVRPDHLQRRAKVFVREDQVSLVMGRRGQNRRLASELCGFEIEIVPLGETRGER
jgi:transcription termination/antitermination protein NusA